MSPAYRGLIAMSTYLLDIALEYGADERKASKGTRHNCSKDALIGETNPVILKGREYERRRAARSQSTTSLRAVSRTRCGRKRGDRARPGRRSQTHRSANGRRLALRGVQQTARGVRHGWGWAP